MRLKQRTETKFRGRPLVGHQIQSGELFTFNEDKGIHLKRTNMVFVLAVNDTWKNSRQA